jgi:hypothetical protein
VTQTDNPSILLMRREKVLISVYWMRTDRIW